MPTAARATSQKPVAQREITLVRMLDAPRELVFSLWTDANHLAQWWSPHTYTNPVCEADARPGGAILIHMRGPSGNIHVMDGVYREITPPSRIVFTTSVDDNGVRVLEGHNVVTFEDVGGKTRLTVQAQASGFIEIAKMMLGGMEQGWSQSLEKLEVLTARNVSADAAIWAVLAEHSRAHREKDAALMIKLFTDDIASFSLAPPLQRIGADARNAASFESWFKTWRGGIGLEFGDLAIATGGNIAFAYGLGRMTGTKTDGAVIDLWTRYSIGFRREGGAWKIANLHTSVPFHMDGGFKAAVDLKP
jgi:uncharacterized protein YndB with AHSA1/START domain/ketosteroid isomerase-like protein